MWKEELCNWENTNREGKNDTSMCVELFNSNKSIANDDAALKL